MRASKGGLTHDAILKLTWRQFGVYLDAFTWVLREESDKGRADNRRDDLRAETQEPLLKEAKQKLLAETKAKTARYKAYGEKMLRGPDMR